MIVFFCFTFLYLLRVLIDWNHHVPYYMKYSELSLYLFSFTVIPFVGVNSFRLNHNMINSAFKALLFGGVIFSVLATFSYSKFLGEVSRLNTTTADEWVLSPLALSYCSITIISTFTFYLMTNKDVSKKIKVVMLSSIVLSIIPFLLGAGRGATLAILFSFAFYMFSKSKIKHLLYGLIVVFVLSYLVYIFDSYTQSSLIERFTSIGSDIEEQNSSASRIYIWEYAFNQFLENPIFGDTIAVKGWHGYAHNIFIETLQTIGIFGFTFLLILVIKGLRISYKIIKFYPRYTWVCILFLQALVQNSFSGAIYTASWLWLSLGFLFAINNYIYESSYNNRTPTKL